MIEAGTYRARGLTAALGETKNGNEQVGVQLELLDHEGQSITWYGYFTEKTTDSTLKALRTLGWQGSDLSDLTGVDANEVQIVIERETYEGKERARVRWINSTGGLAMQSQLAPDKAKAFAARMKGAVVAFDKSAGGNGNGSKATPAPKRAAPNPNKPSTAPYPTDDVPPPGDDDLPF